MASVLRCVRNTFGGLRVNSQWKSRVQDPQIDLDYFLIASLLIFLVCNSVSIRY